MKPDVDQYFLKSTIVVGWTPLVRRSTFFCERDEANMNKADTIKDMIEGQVEDIVAVYRANEATGQWSDVSEDFALDIIKEAERQNRVNDDGELDVACLAFLEMHASEALAEVEGQYARSDAAEHGTMHRAFQGV